MVWTGKNKNIKCGTKIKIAMTYSFFGGGGASLRQASEKKKYKLINLNNNFNLVKWTFCMKWNYIGLYLGYMKGNASKRMGNHH